MAEQKPEVMFENLMKAYKFDYENASNPLLKTQAKQKANKLRDMASLFGIDQSTLDKFGDTVLLKDTPGGETIDYGTLAQTGKIWASLAGDDPQSIAKRGIGQAIITGLPKFGRTGGATGSQNAAYGKFLGEPTSVLEAGQQRVDSATTTAAGAVRPAGVATGIPSALPNAVPGQAVRTNLPGASLTPPVMTQYSSAGSATNALDAEGPTAAVNPNPVPGPAVTGTMVTPGGTGTKNPSGTIVTDEDGTEEPVNVGASDTQMEAYVKSGDFVGWITSQPWCPTMVDPATGKTVPDYSKFDAGAWAAWSQQVTLFGNAASLVDEANGTYTKLEEQPGWKEYLAYMDVNLQARLDNAKTAYDNTMAHYQNAQTAINERQKVALADIQNVLNISMWKSRQSLAATGMVFSGLLAWGYQQGQFQAQQSAANVIINATEDFNNISADMATLGADYELEKKNATNAQIATIALERYKWLYGENEEYLKAQKALKSAMTALGLSAQTAPGLVAGTNQAAVAEAASAAADDAKWWLTTSIDALSKGINVVQNKDGTVTLTQGISPTKLAELRLDAAKAGFTIAEDGTVSGTGITNKQIGDWMADGIYYDPSTGKITQTLTPAEAEDQRHNLELERIARLTTGQQAARDAETARHNKAMEKNGATTTKSTADPWGTGYTQTQFENDLKVINNTSLGITQTQRSVAALNLGLGTGAALATDQSFGTWLTGSVGGVLTGVDGQPVLDAAGKQISTPAALGFLALTEDAQDKMVQMFSKDNDDEAFIATAAGHIQRELLNKGIVPTKEAIMQVIMSITALDADGNPVSGPSEGGVAGGGASKNTPALAFFDASEQQRILAFLETMFESGDKPVQVSTAQFFKNLGANLVTAWTYGAGGAWNFGFRGSMP